MFDIVIVPDFAGSNYRLFEIRTLFFLSFWLENAGKARHYPIHIACIGEPPMSVRWLASQCQAKISIHHPFEIGSGQTTNKLRGFEVTHNTDNLLLLDVDVMCLADPSGFTDMKNCILAAASIQPRVPERHWQKIYPSLGLEIPTKRIKSTISKIGKINRQFSYPEQNFESEKMLPYYNSGILYMPWKFANNLRPVWEDHIYKIRSLFIENNYNSVGGIFNSDQAGFATAVEYLLEFGINTLLMPDKYHGNWIHLLGGILRLSDIILFHATSSFKGLKLENPSPNHFNFGPSWIYQNFWLEVTRTKLCLKKQRLIKFFFPTIIDTCKLTIIQQRIFNKYIRIALSKNSSKIN